MTLDPDKATASIEAEDTLEHRSQVRKAALASTVGTTIEWYDFFLYNTAAALIFPALFFPESSNYAGQLESFATYAVGFAARPVGAFIFGHYGDRIGRKATLIITLLMMGLATTCVGLLPGTDSIGIGRPSCWSSCGCCRASRSAVSGAGRSCCRWSGATRSGAASWPACPSSGWRSA